MRVIKMVCRDENLLYVWQLIERDLAANIGGYGHLAPTDNVQFVLGERSFYRSALRYLSCFILRQEDHAHGIVIA